MSLKEDLLNILKNRRKFWTDRRDYAISTGDLAALSDVESKLAEVDEAEAALSQMPG
jgi:hypothetical protein